MLYGFCDQQVKLAQQQKLRHVVKKYVQPTNASDPIWGYQWNLVSIITQRYACTIFLFILFNFIITIMIMTILGISASQEAVQSHSLPSYSTEGLRTYRCLIPVFWHKTKK